MTSEDWSVDADDDTWCTYEDDDTWITVEEVQDAMRSALERTRTMVVADEPYTGVMVAAAEIGYSLRRVFPDFDWDSYMKGCGF